MSNEYAGSENEGGLSLVSVTWKEAKWNVWIKTEISNHPRLRQQKKIHEFIRPKPFDPEMKADAIESWLEAKILIKIMIDVFLIDFINNFSFLAFSVALVTVRWVTRESDRDRKKNFNLLDVGSWPIAYQNFLLRHVRIARQAVSGWSADRLK